MKNAWKENDPSQYQYQTVPLFSKFTIVATHFSGKGICPKGMNYP